MLLFTIRFIRLIFTIIRINFILINSNLIHFIIRTDYFTNINFKINYLLNFIKKDCQTNFEINYLVNFIIQTQYFLILDFNFIIRIDWFEKQDFVALLMCFIINLINYTINQISFILMDFVANLNFTYLTSFKCLKDLVKLDFG